MKTLLLICLSLSIIGCAGGDIPEKPPGWSCTFYFEGVNSSFLCNGIQDPKTRKEFSLVEAETEGMQCMPNRTFERYTAYVETLKELARKRCR